MAGDRVIIVSNPCRVLAGACCSKPAASSHSSHFPPTHCSLCPSLYVCKGAHVRVLKGGILGNYQPSMALQLRMSSTKFLGFFRANHVTSIYFHFPSLCLLFVVSPTVSFPAFKGFLFFFSLSSFDFRWNNSWKNTEPF